MKGLDFTLAKDTRRSTLFKLSKEAKKKMMKEKKKLSLRRAQRSQRRIQERLEKAKKKVAQ